MDEQTGNEQDETKPAPEPATNRRRLGLTLGAAVVALVVMGGGAFAAIRLWPSPAVDPAERIPDSVVFYSELNLDPGSDQTRMLARLADKFDLFEDASDPDEVISVLLDELDLDDIDSDDLTRWVGTRAAAAVLFDSVEQPYLALALASRNDSAAEAGLANILEASDDEFGYVVDDGLAMLVFGETEVQSRAERLAVEGRDAPLATSASFQSDIEWLDGEQFALMWSNIDQISTLVEETMPLDLALTEVEFGDIYNVYSVESLVVGLRATDSGIDITYRSDGDNDSLAGRADWLEALGGLPRSQIAALLALPGDLSELSEPLVETMDQRYNAPLEGLDDYIRGQWDYEMAMTDEQLAEYDTLFGQWLAGQLNEDDPEFDRLVELEDQFALFGLQSEFDEWIADGGESEQLWRYERALTHDEFVEFVLLESSFVDGSLSEEAEIRFFELDSRLFSFGLVSDYEFYEPPFDAAALVEQIYELLSGATFTIAIDAVLGEPQFSLAVELAEGTADRVLDLPIPDLDQLVAELGDDLVFEGPTLAYGRLDGSGETLADHPRFDEAFADAPGEAIMAAFVDVGALNADAAEPEDWLEPVSVVGWAQDATSGVGMIRVLID